MFDTSSSNSIGANRRELRPLDTLGKTLQRELKGTYSARRSAFRIVYKIDEEHHQVIVLRVEHRVDVYRPY